ncbi:phytoene desaturase [Arcanobacterium phocisimile]|uniref:Phytoene desaturase n=1 Tax=Arcanobacterium phocisimile TaxID=1302235 RepID=A0ABX7IG72_9ACTO|nr:phytoene desaturase family protein [Arcanobacterium phocisimile]QRV01755.1 phytoene desaturase [Arcanobacterium phocisimile]
MRSTRYPHVTKKPSPSTKGATAQPRAVVIGGGIAGIATAGLLARDGYAVDLLEQNPHVGGRVDQLKLDGFTFDLGPTWYLMPEVFEHYFALLGADINDYLKLEKLDPAYRLYLPDGQSLDVRSGVENAKQLFESREPGSGERLERHLASAEHTYELALRNFLYTNFQSVLPWLNPDILTGIPRLLTLLTQSLEAQAKTVADDPVLQQLLTFHAVFLSAAPDMVPSMYHLMTHLDLGDGVLYPKGGLRALVSAMEERVRELGVQIHTNTTATKISTTPGGRGLTKATVSGVEAIGPTGALSFPADVVVGAGDLWGIETKLLPENLQSYPQSYWEKSTDGIGTVLATLGVSGELPQLAHHSFFFTSDWKANFKAIFEGNQTIPNPASTYVCRASASDSAVAPEGHEALFLLIPVTADPQIGAGSLTRTTGYVGPEATSVNQSEMTDEAISRAGDSQVETAVDNAIAQISQWANIPDLAERIVLRRTIGPADHLALYGSFHGNALGQAHTLGQSAFLRARSASQKIDGLVYAGQTTAPGIGVPMALISAENVLKRLHGDTSVGPVPEPKDAPRRSRLDPSVAE